MEFPIFFLLTVVAFIVFFYLKVKFKVKAILETLRADETGPNTWQFPVDSARVTMNYEPGSRSQGTRVTIFIPGRFAGEFKVRRENMLDRASKKLGINKEAQILDPDFDEKFYFEGEDEAFIQTIMGLSGVRSAVRAALQYFSYFEIKSDQCSYVKSDYLLSQLKAEEILEVARNLVSVIDQMTQVKELDSEEDGDNIVQPSSKWLSRYQKNHLFDKYLIVEIVLAGIAFFYFSFGSRWFRPLDQESIFKASLIFSLPLFTILAFIVFKQLKGASNSLQRIIPLLFLGGFGVIVCGGMLFTIANDFFDHSAAARYELPVQRKSYSHSSKSSSHYYLQLPFSFKDQTFFYLEVPYQEYNRINISDKCVVEIKRGAFGFEWISSYHCN